MKVVRALVNEGGAMPRISRMFSLIVHLIVIGAAMAYSVLAPGPLPTPRQMLAFDDADMVKVFDIELPAPAPHRDAAPVDTVSPDAAPLEAPHGITAETGLEGVHAASSSEVIGIENAGGGALDSVGTVERVAPPPPPPPPQTPIHLRSGMQPPRKIVDARPSYPAIAQAARVGGMVILEAVIDAQGNVEAVRVLRSIPLLDRAAVDAVKQWTFTPTLLNGVPVPIVMTVTVNFELR
jgi:TonB family protein